MSASAAPNVVPVSVTLSAVHAMSARSLRAEESGSVGSFQLARKDSATMVSEIRSSVARYSADATIFFAVVP